MMESSLYAGDKAGKAKMLILRCYCVNVSNVSDLTKCQIFKKCRSFRLVQKLRAAVVATIFIHSVISGSQMNHSIITG